MLHHIYRNVGFPSDIFFQTVPYRISARFFLPSTVHCNRVTLWYQNQ